MIEIIGTIASALFTFSIVPTFLKIVRDGKNFGIPFSAIICVLLGNILFSVYLLLRGDFGVTPLLLCYLFGIVIWSVILYYDLVPRKK